MSKPTPTDLLRDRLEGRLGASEARALDRLIASDPALQELAEAMEAAHRLTSVLADPPRVPELPMPTPEAPAGRQRQPARKRTDRAPRRPQTPRVGASRARGPSGLFWLKAAAVLVAVAAAVGLYRLGGDVDTPVVRPQVPGVPTPFSSTSSSSPAPAPPVLVEVELARIPREVPVSEVRPVTIPSGLATLKTQGMVGVKQPSEAKALSILGERPLVAIVYHAKHGVTAQKLLRYVIGSSYAQRHLTGAVVLLNQAKPGSKVESTLATRGGTYTTILVGGEAVLHFYGLAAPNKLAAMLQQHQVSPRPERWKALAEQAAALTRAERAFAERNYGLAWERLTAAVEPQDSKLAGNVAVLRLKIAGMARRAVLEAQALAEDDRSAARAALEEAAPRFASTPFHHDLLTLQTRWAEGEPFPALRWRSAAASSSSDASGD